MDTRIMSDSERRIHIIHGLYDRVNNLVGYITDDKKVYKFSESKSDQYVGRWDKDGKIFRPTTNMYTEESVGYLEERTYDGGSVCVWAKPLKNVEDYKYDLFTCDTTGDIDNARGFTGHIWPAHSDREYVPSGVPLSEPYVYNPRMDERAGAAAAFC